MNRLVSAGIGALLSLALAASASAAQLATINPADPSFTLQGPVLFTRDVYRASCTLALAGNGQFHGRGHNHYGGQTARSPASWSGQT